MEWLEIFIEATPYGREILRVVLDRCQIYQSEEVLSEPEVLRALKETAETWDYMDQRAVGGQHPETGGIRFYLPYTGEGRCRLDEIQRHMERLRGVAEEERAGKQGEVLCAAESVGREPADEGRERGDGSREPEDGSREPEGCGEDPGSWYMTVSVRPDEDWHRSWKAYFHGFEVGERLFVKPAWEQRDRERVGNRALVELEVGGSFGTGDHASTRLCLEWLEKHVRPHTTLLDMGSGSGILFIAALLLGADKAFAADRDPHAVAEAVRNAGLNRLDTARYRVSYMDVLGTPPQVSGEERDASLFVRECLDFLGEQGADLIVANVTADVIICAGSLLDVLLKPGGVFLASGILDSRWPDVEAFFKERGLVLLQKEQSQGWVAAAAQFPKKS